MNLREHPTVVALRSRPRVSGPPAPLSAHAIKQLARQCGADDVGLVELERPALDDQRALIRQVYGDTRSLLAFVVRMNREPVRSAVRSVANLNRERALRDALAAGELHVTGSLERLHAFAACFPHLQ